MLVFVAITLAWIASVVAAVLGSHEVNWGIVVLLGAALWAGWWMIYRLVVKGDDWS